MSDDRRVSMNTSLKNARIFDDDSWDTEQVTTKLTIKTEVEDDYEEIGTKMTTETEFEFDSENRRVNIKTEPVNETLDFMHSDNAQFGDILLNNRQNVMQLKTEKLFTRRNEPVVNFNITRETFMSNIRVKTELEESTNDSVSNDSVSNQSRKSMKRTVFKRDSPYTKSDSLYVRRDLDDNAKRNLFKKEAPGENPSSPSSSDSRNSNNVKRKKTEYESDPIVLSRRQKQIDYGKNTIGYDNFIKTVARGKRKSDDPQTPNKFLKYSRRAWDGLIKQWRLRLHKYDPDVNT